MASKRVSNAQIDKLGERLKIGPVTPAELIELEHYRQTFAEAYASVADVIRRCTSIEPTGRASKSTKSIVEKLQRESIRLSQLQDVAGCRIVVPRLAEQDSLVASLASAFPVAHVAVVDRRERPSHGYRAVHVIARIGDRRIEIQVRTALQHVWAELCETLADQYGQSVKYGDGPTYPRQVLEDARDEVKELEEFEGEIERDKRSLQRLGEALERESAQPESELRAKLQEIAALDDAMEQDLSELREQTSCRLRRLILELREREQGS